MVKNYSNFDKGLFFMKNFKTKVFLETFYNLLQILSKDEGYEDGVRD